MNDTESPPLAPPASLPAAQTSLHTTATVSDPTLGNTVIVDSLATQETPRVQKNSYAAILQKPQRIITGSLDFGCEISFLSKTCGSMQTSPNRTCFPFKRRKAMETYRIEGQATTDVEDIWRLASCSTGKGNSSSSAMDSGFESLQAENNKHSVVDHEARFLQWYVVEYENVPNFCSLCKSIEHAVSHGCYSDSSEFKGKKDGMEASAQVQQTKNQQRDKQIMEENVQTADTQKPTSGQESHDKDKEKERTVDVNEKKTMETTPISTPVVKMPNITDLSVGNITIDLPFSALNERVSAGVEEVINKVTTASWTDQAENEEQGAFTLVQAKKQKVSLVIDSRDS
ncbi:hypothetical protein TIFTF001_026076 [Ficus carica]|uniref:Uncharacterized protein n=1 Tax=Ficus carica TaxID=3494 RepID=A0AA88DG18_FICCA|nr:hypothetical protein TIFTF001_026076 [Ficus carica]